MVDTFTWLDSKDLCFININIVKLSYILGRWILCDYWGLYCVRQRAITVKFNPCSPGMFIVSSNSGD